MEEIADLTTMFVANLGVSNKSRSQSSRKTRLLHRDYINNNRPQARAKLSKKFEILTKLGKELIWAQKLENMNFSHQIYAFLAF